MTLHIPPRTVIERLEQTIACLQPWRTFSRIDLLRASIARAAERSMSRVRQRVTNQNFTGRQHYCPPKLMKPFRAGFCSERENVPSLDDPNIQVSHNPNPPKFTLQHIVQNPQWRV